MKAADRKRIQRERRLLNRERRRANVVEGVLRRLNGQPFQQPKQWWMGVDASKEHSKQHTYVTQIMGRWPS